MRLSQLPLKTLRQAPSDAESPSHRLLLRSGQLLRMGPGLFAHGTILTRVLEKLAGIFETELRDAGVSRLTLPTLQPKEIWHPSGSWTRLAAEQCLLKLQDRKGAELCLAPGAEEGLLRYMNHTVDSYKQLPLRCSLLERHFYDLPHPRGGLLGARETQQFAVLSCDRDEQSMFESHGELARAIERGLVRAGLRLLELHSPDRAKGAGMPRAFFAESQAGTDVALHCDVCGYAAQQDRAEAQFAESPDTGEAAPMRKLPTPGIRSVEELERFFEYPASRMAKTILFEVVYAERDEIVAALMRGDLEIDPHKLRRQLGALAVRTAPPQFVERVTGAELGFAGPIGLKEDIRVVADLRLQGQKNLLTGCCETGFHCLDVNPGRDFAEPEYLDIARAEAGMPCAQYGHGVLRARRGILLGHSLPRGSGLARSMDALFVDEDGDRKPYWLSSHWLDLGRLAAAIVEQHHDADGIVWPESVAPFEIVVAMLDPRRAEQSELAERIYRELRDKGRDVCLDDRQLSPGAKFKDLDLLGFPKRIVVGRAAGDGEVEFSRRTMDDKELVDANALLARL